MLVDPHYVLPYARDVSKQHHSRRDVLASIAVAGQAALLLPLVPGIAFAKDTGVLRGSLRDGATGKHTYAKMRLIDVATGQEVWPAKAIRTMPERLRPGGFHYFYATGEFEFGLPAGTYRVEVVRGIAHQAAIQEVTVGPGQTQVLDVTIEPLRDMHAAGWFSGNTHTHYNVELDEEPDDRLRIVPPAEALDISVLSYLIRGDLKYLSNKYPIGRLAAFSKNGTIVDMGEEARNNKGSYDFGYGHVLFMNIPRLVEPVSTGLLSNIPNAPDFPTISMLCQKAKRIGGTTIWCHNGQGMELPTAAAVGAIDAFNVGDSEEGEYERYYQFLNCGFRMPLSTGTDWWIYDHNRAYVHTGSQFSYENWLAGIRAGRTFVTNGPLLTFAANGESPGGAVNGPGTAKVRAEVVSRLPFDRLEVVHDGEIVAEKTANGLEAMIETEVHFHTPGWVAARITSQAKTHAGFRVFAHTGPVYLHARGRPRRQQDMARQFVAEINDSITFIEKVYRFQSASQAAIAIGRFKEGRRYYERLG